LFGKKVSARFPDNLILLNDGDDGGGLGVTTEQPPEQPP
jgi:hypothetical protein